MTLQLIEEWINKFEILKDFLNLCNKIITH